MQIKKLQSTVKIPALKRVCAYARVSSGKESMLHSLGSQVSYYSSYIQGHRDWLYCGVFSDEDFTGTKNDRPGFQTMLQKAKNHEIDIILTKSISRFARNTVDLIKTIRELRELKVDVWFEQEHIQSMSPQGDLLLTLLASSAQEESRATSERMKWAIKKSFEEGKLWGGDHCYGYKIVNRKFVINPEEVDLVKRIFNLYESGMGDLVIAKLLNKEKVPTHSGGLWKKQTIKYIISNPNYTGDLYLQKTFRNNHIEKTTKRNRGSKPMYIVENDHEPIITKEQFERVTELRKKRTVQYNAGLKVKVHHPFDGMLKCANCGRLFRFKKGPYRDCYICGTFADIGKAYCQSKQIPDRVLLPLITNELGLEEFNEDILRKTIEIIIVKNGNILELHYKNGVIKELHWDDPKRSDGWTPEMKQKMSDMKKGKLICQK